MTTQNEHLVDVIEEYCRAYCVGFHEGESDLKEDDLVASIATVAHSPSKAYRVGYSEGLAAGRRVAYAEPSQELFAREDVLEEVHRLEADLGRFTDEQGEQWKILQSQIAAGGDKSWQQILLDLYRHLELFQSGAKMSEDEKAALHLLQQATVIRLSRTRLAVELSS